MRRRLKRQALGGKDQMKPMGTKPTERVAELIPNVRPSANQIRGGSLLRSQGAARAGAALAERARSEFDGGCRSRWGASMRRRPPNSALQLTRAAGPNGQPEAAVGRPAQLNAQR